VLKVFGPLNLIVLENCLMAHSHGHAHAHDHSNGHDHSHSHHPHSHGPASPHPAQPVTWSILRMTLVARLAAAAAISAGLWAIVLMAMR
jgi:hypothetical protein